MEHILKAYESEKRFIMRFAPKYLPCWIDREDIWQDVLLDGLSYFSRKYDPARASLKTAVMDRGKRFLLKIRYRPEVRILEDERTAPVDMMPWIWMVTRDLPPRLRMIVRMYAEGHRLREIGFRLGLSKQRCGILLHKACLSIKEEWEVTMKPPSY